MTPKRQLAQDFYDSPLSQPYKASLHKITLTEFKEVAETIKHKALNPPQYAVIKVESKYLRGIEHLLRSRGIEYETPECFELIEKYESKMNEL